MVTSSVVLIALYAAIILWLVAKGARRIKSMSDYAVGSIQFSPWSVGLSLAAAITSAATFIINPGFIALYGYSAILAFAVVMPLGLFISLAVLSKSFRKYGTNVKALTIAQWIGSRYGNAHFALFFAVLSLLLITFMVLLCVGMTKVLAQALNANELVVLVVMVVFIYGYMMFGGANSMVYTNTIQAMLMLVVAFILLGSGHEHFAGGLSALTAKLKAIDPGLVQWKNPGSYQFRDFFEIVICSFVVGIAVVCQPHIITKSLLLRSERDVNRYLVIGIIIEAIFFAVVITGLYARLLFPDLTVNGQALKMDGIIPAYVIAEFPVFAGLLVIMGLISAGLSTLEGLIQSLSTTITSDLIVPLSGRLFGDGDSKSRRLILVNRMVIAVLGLVTILLSIQQLTNPGLSVGIFAQNGVYAYFSAAFIPVLMGIFLPRTPLLAPVVAAITAIVVHFAVYYGGITWYMQAPVRNPAVAATFAIMAASLTGFIAYIISKNKRVQISQ